MQNIILNTDSYKVSMWEQYQPKTEGVFSYIEARGGDYDYTVMFGLQIFLKEYLSKPITQENIDEAEFFYKAHGEPFNKEGWTYILDVYEGRLPLVIKAVPEGTVVPVSNVLVTVENTDPKCFWLTTWIETALLRAVWYGTTVATTSYSIKQVIKSFMEKTGADLAGLPFKLHDFGARGVSSGESAGIGGAAHLVNFMGTDTIQGAWTAMKYYNTEMPGFSIPAAEHSTITSWGKENEVEAFRNMLNKFGGEGKLLAVVSDSYDIYNAAYNLWGQELKQEVIDSGAMVVIRPDSGDPVTVVCEVLQLLDERFGSIINDAGYKVLNNVRVIQGDGINESSIREILEAATEKGFSADNVAFGMGGALLQHMDRDTQKWAMKCSATLVDGKWFDVWKDPVTDKGKGSKRGRLTLVKDDFNNYRTVTEDAVGDQVEVLVEVFRDGIITKEYIFEEVRDNSIV